MTLGQRIVANLQQEQVEYIFSQGELSLKEIQKHAIESGLKLIGPRHEAAGVWMAAAAYRLTGRPQVAMGAQGPGVANMLPAAVWAAEERIPIVLIGASRQFETTSGIRRGRFLVEESLPGCFKEICKFAHRIYHPRQVDEVMQTAFRNALSGTPGPVYIEVDSAGQTESWDYGPLTKPSEYRVLSQPASDSAIAEACKLIESSRSILLLGGEEVHSSRTHEQFLRLAELLKCPVITTFGGAGAIKQTHPQWLAYSSNAGKEAIEKSDLVIAVGTCIPENINYGKQRHFAPGDANRQWIQLDPDPAAIAINRSIHLPVIGRLQESLQQLCVCIEKSFQRDDNPNMARWREDFEHEQDARLKSVSSESPIDPNKLMLEAREAIPDDAVIVSDAGFTIVYQHDSFEKRSNDFLWGAFGAHVGTGLPQAVGAQLAVGGDRLVCLLCGDGALGMHIMELETAVRHELPIVVIVNDDRAFAAELAALDEHMGSMPECFFRQARYDLFLEHMGGHGEYVEHAEDIQPAIKRAIASGKTALVQVITDQMSGLKYPPFSGEELYAWVHEDVAQMNRV
tara:strand:+ start:126753 stop:128459 length:1707 start_codon:yes stop_codon:yes gene_type:complete